MSRYKCQMFYSKCQMSNSKCHIPNVKFKISNSKCQMLNVKLQMPKAKCHKWNIKCDIWLAKCPKRNFTFALEAPTSKESIISFAKLFVAARPASPISTFVSSSSARSNVPIGGHFTDRKLVSKWDKKSNLRRSWSCLLCLRIFLKRRRCEHQWRTRRYLKRDTSLE